MSLRKMERSEFVPEANLMVTGIGWSKKMDRLEPFLGVLRMQIIQNLSPTLKLRQTPTLASAPRNNRRQFCLCSFSLMRKD